MEENIEVAEKSYLQLNKLLVDVAIEVGLTNEDMLEKYTLSDEFKEIFINQTYEEDIYIKDVTINSNIIICSLLLRYYVI